MSDNRGPFIEETRRCPHGRRFDDKCTGCEIDEMAYTILSVADYLNDACNNQGEILGSKCVDPLMHMHGQLTEISVAIGRVGDPDAWYGLRDNFKEKS